MKISLCLLVIGVTLVASAPVNDLQKNEIARDILRDLLNHDDNGEFRDYIKTKVKKALHDPKYREQSDETESVFDQEEDKKDENDDQQEAALLLNEDKKIPTKSDEKEDAMKILSDELKDIPTNDIEKYLKSREQEANDDKVDAKDNDVQTDLDYLFEAKNLPKGPETISNDNMKNVASVKKDGIASPPSIPTTSEYNAGAGEDETAPILDEDYGEKTKDEDEEKTIFEETLKDEIKKRVAEALHKRQEDELKIPHVKDSLKELIKQKVRDALAKRFGN